MASFIDQLAPYAIKHGQSNNILPSFICAQGILESASGTSSLAKNANNLFGIKKGSNWTNKVFSVITGEYDSSNKYFEIVAEFRSYPTYEGCVIDLCDKYSHGTGWEPFNRYQAVIGETDYKKATEAIYKAGYATDPLYPQKLNKIIEQYDLTKYDKEMTQKMVKIALDAGHGINTAGKRTPDGEREWSFNNKVLIACAAKLNTYENVQILRLDDATGKTDVPLVTRTNKANTWKADVLVSIHHNALAGKWHSGGGVETFVQEKTASKTSKDLAANINPRIVKAMGLRDRGVKTSNLHMLRESVCPAILSEGGFMDSTTDISALRSDTKLKVQGEAIADGLAAHFKLKSKTTGKPVPSTPPAPTQPQPKEESGIKMLITTSGTLKKMYQDYLQDAINKKYIDKKWLNDFNQDRLSISDAFLLDKAIDVRKAGK